MITLFENRIKKLKIAMKKSINACNSDIKENILQEALDEDDLFAIQMDTFSDPNIFADWWIKHRNDKNIKILGEPL